MIRAFVVMMIGCSRNDRNRIPPVMDDNRPGSERGIHSGKYNKPNDERSENDAVAEEVVLHKVTK